MKKMNRIPYGRQSIEDEDIEAVVRTLKSDFLTQGPMVPEFERLFSDYLARQSQSQEPIYSVAVTNGTGALHIAAAALGVNSESRVLVAANSFVASANCIRFLGGEVEFVDINPSNHCMDFAHLKELLLAAPRGTYQGLVVVDFAGHPVDMETVRSLADEHGIWVIEDACHAIGATSESKLGNESAGSGRFAECSVFSFHPVKHIATGEGGMVVTRSKALYEKLLSLRSHGITRDPKLMSKNDGGWYYEMTDLGFNYRISDVLCALGVSQLKKIDQNLVRRRELAKRYREELANLPVKLPEDHPGHAYHLFVIETDLRKELYDYLIAREIGVQVHYIPIYQQPYYQERYGKIALPNCEKYYQRCLSIPMYHSLSHEDQDRVIQVITEFFCSR